MSKYEYLSVRNLLGTAPSLEEGLGIPSVDGFQVGQLFLSYDRRKLFRWNGAIWEIALQSTGTINIGDTVGGGTPKSVLFIGGAGVLAEDTNLTWNGNELFVLHITGVAGTLVATPGAGAGAGAFFTVRGTDVGGFVLITPGGLPTPGDVIVSIAYAVPYSADPRSVIISPANEAAASLLTSINMPYVDLTSCDLKQFTIKNIAGGSLNPLVDYLFCFQVIQ